MDAKRESRNSKLSHSAIVPSIDVGGEWSKDKRRAEAVEVMLPVA